MNVTNQEFVVPVLGIIWIISVIISLLSYFTKIDFGIIGILSWVVTIVGFFCFLIWVAKEIFSF